MNIKFKNYKVVKIEGLGEGDTFISSDETMYNSPTVYMVIDEPFQFFVNKDEYTYDKYAVNLENGRIIGFDNNDEVVLVNCDSTVTIK